MAEAVLLPRSVYGARATVLFVPPLAVWLAQGEERRERGERERGGEGDARAGYGRSARTMRSCSARVHAAQWLRCMAAAPLWFVWKVRTWRERWHACGAPRDATMQRAKVAAGARGKEACGATTWPCHSRAQAASKICCAARARPFFARIFAPAWPRGAIGPRRQQEAASARLVVEKK